MKHVIVLNGDILLFNMDSAPLFVSLTDKKQCTLPFTTMNSHKIVMC